MNKISLIGIITLFAVVFAGSANAAGWKKEVLNDGIAYSTEHANVSCRVLVENDGSLTVGATDYAWHGKVAEHVAGINSMGQLVSNITYSYVTIGGNKKFSEKGYPVFLEKCSEFTEDLPWEVRNALSQAFE